MTRAESYLWLNTAHRQDKRKEYDMAKLGYTTILSQFKKGDNAPCYSARVKHNGTVSTDDYSGGDTNETMQSNK